MKKLLTSLCLSLLLIVPSVSAFELYVRGEKVENVVISDIKISDGVVDIDTNVGLSADGTVTPPTPTPNPPKAPVVKDRCVNSQLVVCRYNISERDWNSTKRVKVKVQVPGGVDTDGDGKKDTSRTLVSSFTTSAGSDSIDIGFTTPPGDKNQLTRVWISDKVLGDPVGRYCSIKPRGYTYLVKASTHGYQCSLEKNTKYFLHMQHVRPTDPENGQYRELTVGTRK